MGYTKEKAISVVTSCAQAYRDNLVDKSLLLVYLDKHKRTACVELTFDAGNYLHLTGLKPIPVADKDGKPYQLSALDFYHKCLDRRLRACEFEFDANGTTPLKLDVLPSVINKNLSARMIGNCDSPNPQLYTEKLVGGVRACVGFVLAAPGGRYVPNTVLKVDIRDYASDVARVIAVFRKNKTDSQCNQGTMRPKRADFPAGLRQKSLKYASIPASFFLAGQKNPTTSGRRFCARRAVVSRAARGRRHIVIWQERATMRARPPFRAKRIVP